MFAKTSRLVQLIVSLCALVAFASCSNMQQGRRLEDDEQTLRALTEEMAAGVPWTDELESNRLTANIGTVDGIARNVALSPLAMLAKTDDGEVLPVYPFLDGFGSLDTTLIAEDARTVLTGFCDALNRAESADAFMAAGCLYQLALFYRDVDLVKPESASDTAQADAKTTAELSPTDAAEDAPVFTFFDSYFYGQPYVTGTMYEIPVRFVGADRSLDLLIFLLRENGTWKVDELQILASERADGK